MGDWIQVGPADNRAYLAVPPSGKGPGVLVLHAWWGLTSTFTDICDQLAQAGFVALAPNLYLDGATATTIPEAEALAKRHNEESDAAQDIVLSATDILRELPAVTGDKLGVIGFSLGAYWALLLSQVRPGEIAAAVTVYGTDDGDYSTARAAYLGHFAEHDDYEETQYVQALEERIRTAGREVTFHTYPGTGHWFVEPNQPAAYNAEAAALVWERTVEFLNANLG